MKLWRFQTFRVTFVSLTLIIASRGESIEKRSLWFRAQTFEGEPFATSQECECHFRHVPPKDRRDFIEGDDQWIGHVFKEEEPGTILDFCHATLLWNKHYAKSQVVVGWMIKTFVVNEEKKLDDYPGKAHSKKLEMSSTETSHDENTTIKTEQVDPDEMTTNPNEAIGYVTTRTTKTIDFKTEFNDQEIDMTKDEAETVLDAINPSSNDVNVLGLSLPSLGSGEIGQESDKLRNSEDDENQGSSETKDTDDIDVIETIADPLNTSESTTSNTSNISTASINGDEHQNLSQEKKPIIEEPSLNIAQTEPDDYKETVSLKENNEMKPQTHVDQDESTTPFPNQPLKDPQHNRDKDVVQNNQGEPENFTLEEPSLVIHENATVKPLFLELFEQLANGAK